MMNNKEKLTYEELLERDGFFLYTSVGVSMMPLIRQGRDIICIRAREKDERGQMLPLHELDVALFRRGEQYVLHRVMEVLEDGSYLICGDNQYNSERVDDQQIIGVLDKVIRDGKQLDPCDLEYLAGLEMNLSKRRRMILRKALPAHIKGKIVRTLRAKRK